MYTFIVDIYYYQVLDALKKEINSIRSSRLQCTCVNISDPMDLAMLGKLKYRAAIRSFLKCTPDNVTWSICERKKNNQLTKSVSLKQEFYNSFCIQDMRLKNRLQSKCIFYSGVKILVSKFKTEVHRHIVSLLVFGHKSTLNRLPHSRHTTYIHTTQ